MLKSFIAAVIYPFAAYRTWLASIDQKRVLMKASGLCLCGEPLGDEYRECADCHADMISA